MRWGRGSGDTEWPTTTAATQCYGVLGWSERERLGKCRKLGASQHNFPSFKKKRKKKKRKVPSTIGIPDTHTSFIGRKKWEVAHLEQWHTHKVYAYTRGATHRSVRAFHIVKHAVQVFKISIVKFSIFPVDELKII